ncbi:Acyl-CoA N-acyltransferase [Pseudocohnilembus persalinus]|uniref:Acyl-CoA N-acyltransferase n=1 Tax=Pseudocohnilembus persalinus TaxID=266149 RepID=A0A0V0Q804_PSEPJ|nr:Acyl-CoA N-acyltransferase [Pseudocohnilembus persalinus]|eukprot:KRW98334.1 Acyl-CoA N-acyltransferase [Pseudocohnilembus persalinus]
MQDYKPILARATLENSKIITEFQYIMAKQTEGKELNQQEVLKAVDYLAKNPDYGFFLMAYDQEQQEKKQEIGSLLITYAHEVFQNQPVWWFQSVYVDEKFRGKGVFKQMFQDVEKQVSHLQYPLKLYVETENERAMKVYQKMGMYDANEVYLEDDFYFEDKIKFKENQTLHFKTLDYKNQEEINELLTQNGEFVSQFGQICVDQDKLKQSIEHLSKQPGQGSIIQIKNQEQKLIGSVGIFYEFSDWRNGIMVYISDVRLNQKHFDSEEKLIDFYNGLFYWCKNINKFNDDLPLTCLRVVIDEKQAACNLIKKTGMIEAHYRVYMKK